MPLLVDSFIFISSAADLWFTVTGAARSVDGWAQRILDEVDTARASGDVVVACMGGVGRTGTVAACALVRAGSTARQAIDAVRALRHPTAVETEAQERFVRRYAASRGGEAAGA